VRETHQGFAGAWNWCVSRTLQSEIERKLRAGGPGCAPDPPIMTNPHAKCVPMTPFAGQTELD
jgi:hypothetical protein